MKILNRIINLLVVLFVPVILILLTVRILITPIYIQTEYRLPGFPEDSYGFSFEERLYWANVSRYYLTSNEEINYLADQSLDEDTPLYNDRELRHMWDVKDVIQAAMKVLTLAIVFEIVVGIWAKRSDRWLEFKSALSQGGWFTVGLIIFVLVYLSLNFQSLFTNFHRIFFDGDTWLFRYSDTLIRLFPIRFWRDAFIWVGGLAFISGLCMGYFIPRSQK
jgi:integral membrane protein (TIGR01906 family)